MLAIDPDAALAPIPAATQPAPPPSQRLRPPRRLHGHPAPRATSLSPQIAGGGSRERSGPGRSASFPGPRGRRVRRHRSTTPWSVEPSATLLAATSTDNHDPRGEVDLALGGLALCPLRLQRTRWTGELCGGLELGAMWARGVGFDENQSATSWFASPTLGVGGEVRVAGPLWATGRALLLVPFVRPEVVYGDAQGTARTLYRTPAASGLFGVGLGVHIFS